MTALARDAGGVSAPASRARRWIPPRTIAGVAMMAALIGANVAGFMLDDRSSQLEFNFEPSHIAAVQRLTWRIPVRDTITSSNIFSLQPVETSKTGPVFQNVPVATARVGKPYEYRPRTSARLTGYALQGAVPPGLVVNAETGAITGMPQRAGAYTITLTASLDASRQVERRFPLYVDSRFLVFGADARGRDILRRLIVAMRYTILPGLVAVFVSVVGGTLLGAFAGFHAGPIRRTLRGVATVIQSVPGLLLVFFIAVIAQFQIYAVMVIVGVILLPETANGVRDIVTRECERDFVEAARELGLRDRTILWNEIVWHNARKFLLSRVAQALTFAVLVEVTLPFIGLADRNAARIGAIMLDGRTNADRSLLFALVPVLVLMLVIGTYSTMERGVVAIWERRR